MASYSESGDYPGAAHSTILLQDGDSFTGSSSSAADYDWIPVYLDQSKSYVFKFDNAFDRPEIKIVDASGNSIHQSNNLPQSQSSVSGNTQIWVTPPSTGTYYIRVNGSLFENDPDIGPYEVSVFSEIADTIDTTATMAFNYSNAVAGSYSGQFEYINDKDLIKVYMEPGYTYTYSFEHNSPYASYFYVVDGNGDYVARDNEIYTSDLKPYTVDTAGYYYLVAHAEVSNARPAPLDGVTYQISSYVEAPANAQTKFDLEVGGTVSGKWDTWQDIDWYKVELQAGVSYIVETVSGNMKEVSFANANGTRLESTSQTNSVSNYHIVTPATSGTYYVFANPKDGLYQLALNTEVAGDASSVTSMVTGEKFESKFNFSADADFVGFDVVAGQTYKVDLALSAPSNQRITLEILDATGSNFIVRGGYDLDSTSVEFVATETGKVFAKAIAPFNLQQVLSYELIAKVASAEIEGTDSAESLNGTDSSDVILAKGGNDNVDAGAGDDNVTGGAGNDVINGGTGDDTVVYTGKWSDYTVSLLNGAYTIEDARSGSPDGTDTVTNVEHFAFANGNINKTKLDLTLTSADGQLFFATMKDSSRFDETHELDGAKMVGHGAGFDLVKHLSEQHGANQNVLALAHVEQSLVTGVIDVYVTSDLSFLKSLSASINISAAPFSLPSSQTGTEGVDELTGSAAQDNFDLKAGDDTVTGAGGNDVIDGGAGVDTAKYAGEASHFSVTITKGGATTVLDRKGTEGTDSLTNVENLDFSGNKDVNLDILDGVVNVSSTDLLAFIEMYIAYFNRAPDAEGLFYWGTRLSEGMGKEQIAKSFYVQPETQALYTNPDDTEGFVTAVYNNFLGRAPDAEGFAYWVSELNSGSVSKPIFLLAIINGAKAATGSQTDVDYFTNKANIGAYYSVIKGMSNTDNAKAAMALYDGSAASITAAKNQIDTYYNAALDADNGELLVNLVGVMDDPFAA